MVSKAYKVAEEVKVAMALEKLVEKSKGKWKGY